MKIRGGAAALKRLLDDAEAIDLLLQEISDDKLSVRLIDKHVAYGRRCIAESRDFITKTLDPMLERIDDRKQQDLMTRVEQLSSEVTQLSERLAALEQRQPPAIYEVRKQEGR